MCGEFVYQQACDKCGAVGAYDNEGEYLCPECLDLELRDALESLDETEYRLSHD